MTAPKRQNGRAYSLLICLCAAPTASSGLQSSLNLRIAIPRGVGFHVPVTYQLFSTVLERRGIARGGVEFFVITRLLVTFSFDQQRKSNAL